MQKLFRELKSLALILLIVLGIRSVFFEPFRIPSGSMIPTLMIGDFILVNKFAYGFKVPFTDISFSSLGIDFDPIYLFGKKTPKRGDVVVFKYPRDPSINYIKRVVAVPGDTIEIRKKVLYVNGNPFQREEISGEKYLEDMSKKYRAANLKFFQVTSDERKFVIQLDKNNYFNTDYTKRVVPEGKLFVMGDNRDYSSDSRVWGFVSHKHIKGKALLVWLSMTMPFSAEGFEVNFKRIGTTIR